MRFEQCRADQVSGMPRTIEGHMKILLSGLIIGMLTASMTTGALAAPEPCPRVVSSEPGPHTILFGDKLLVNDSSCPTGLIKQVIGGNATHARKRGCVRIRQDCLR